MVTLTIFEGVCRCSRVVHVEPEPAPPTLQFIEPDERPEMPTLWPTSTDGSMIVLDAPLLPRVRGDADTLLVITYDPNAPHAAAVTSLAEAPMSAETFDDAMQYLLRNEGSLYVNDPRDSGGPTRFGVTQATLSSYRGRPCTAAEVAALTLAEASDLYRSRYWTPIHGDTLAERMPAVAIALFDTSVLHGMDAAVRMAQEVAGAPVDGILGPETRAAIEAVGAERFVLRYISRTLCRCADIVVARPAKIAFFKGWVTRTVKMATLTA